MPAQTARTMSVAIGNRVLYPVANSNIAFDCLVIDAKSSFGNARVLIRPVAGTGELWVNLSSVRSLEEPGIECRS